MRCVFFFYFIGPYGKGRLKYQFSLCFITVPIKIFFNDVPFHL